jgi:Ran GTPase-activating protein (RanGAP) involved in mRNA processing and transport
LVELSLDSNSIGPEGAESISVALQTNKTLELLFLVRNNIGDQGAQSLAQILMVNEGITNLYLYGNNITEDGEEALKAALRARNQQSMPDVKVHFEGYGILLKP